MSVPSDLRLVVLGASIFAAAAIVLTFTALDRTPSQPPTPLVVPSSAEVSAPPARAYSELRLGRRGRNAGLYTPDVGALEVHDDRTADLSSEQERALVRAQRQARRAYDGAPPTVPHAVSQQMADCAGCHVSGLTIAGKRAPKPSHPPMPSCPQCHVPAEDPRPESDLAAQTMPASEFVGLESPGRGVRAWAGAPPTIPHGTQNRSECNSCHGPGGRFGLRTPHPERVSCTQCHVATRARDQRPSWLPPTPNEAP